MHEKDNVVKAPVAGEGKPVIYDYVELSKYAWGLSVEKDKATSFPGPELITMACAQRSAQALETIANNSVALVNDYISVKTELEKLRAEHDLLLAIIPVKIMTRFNLVKKKFLL